MIKLYSIVLFVLAAFSANAQQPFSGTISSNGEPVPFAQLQLQPNQLNTVADFEGNFTFENVETGSYTLKIIALGFKPLEQKIQIPSSTQLTFELEKDIFGLEEFTVTANRSEVSRRNSPIPISVMNQEKLEQLGANTLSEGIKFSPGLRVENNCQNCGFSQVRINGMPGAYSQILIDGKATYSAVNSIYGLDQIPTDMLDRIEVIKGGGSSLYGSNAIAGTINLITKHPVNNSASVRSESSFIGGRNWEQIVAANSSIVSKDLTQGITVFANYRNRNPYDRNEDGFTEIAKLNNIGIGARAFQKIGKQGMLNLEMHTLNEYRRGGDFLHLAPNEANIAEELNSEVYGGSVSFDWISKNQKNKTSVYSGLQSTQIDNYYGGGQDENGFGFTSDFSTMSGVQFTNNSKNIIAGKGEFLAGAEYRTGNMMDEKPGYNLQVDQAIQTAGTFAQYNWKLNGNWILNGGLRYDWFNLNNSSNLSPRLIVLYHPTDKITLRSGYSRGFRIPQVVTEDVHVELVGGEIQAIQLSNNLQAEISDSYTFSFDYDKEWSKGVLEIVVEGFYTQIHNPFVLEERTGNNNISILEKRNGSGAEIIGTNLEFKLSDQRFYALQVGYTLLQSEYKSPVEWSSESTEKVSSFLRTPNAYGNLILDVFALKNTTVTFSSIHTGSMLVPHYAGYIAEDRLENSPHFLELNLKVSYDIKLKKAKKLVAYGGVRNILDSYQEDFDFGMNRDAGYIYGPTAPRTYFVGLKWSWNK